MIDFKTELKAQLETVGLPVYYELFCDSSTTTPCITYIENNNASYIEGNTIGYSTLSFYVKLWGNDLAVLSPFAQKIDNVMRGLGFKRVSYNELSYNTQLQMIFRYEALAVENY